MVTFTCQNCNSSLKKKVVETHLFKCKNPQLTCIDCLKDFDVKSYVGHVTCVTEDERYGGQGFTPSSSMQKQTEWHQCVCKLLSPDPSRDRCLTAILKYASDFPTCPRNKKKFVNFILNNKIFSQDRSLAEKAYDLIAGEFNKSQSSENNVTVNGGKNNEVTEQSSGKRKKISETELQEESVTNGDSDKVTEKISRKKNKHNGENQQENGDSVIRESGHKKNKKKNKQSNSNESDEPTTNGHSAVADAAQTKTKKKNKGKHRKNSTNQESSAAEEEQTNNQVNEEKCTDLHKDVNEEDIKETKAADEGEEKLSKKERKKLLKMKKYKAEIESIENYKKSEEVEGGEGETTASAATTTSDSTLNGEKRKKKKKKHIEEEEARQQKNSISEPDDKKIKLEEEEEEAEEVVAQRPKKFKWDQVIVEVLQGQSDGEMSLKRLSKKVCSEYASILGEPKSWEEVILKFNKKVLRTPGVRVLKDKAKLLTES